MYSVDPTIFRNYDIRGIWGEDLAENTSYLIGRALATFYYKNNNKNPDVVVGMDNRKSSPVAMENLNRGLIEGGANVTEIGLSLTPIIHFLTCTEDFDLGIEVTASHNPNEYNGFRIDYKDAKPFYGDDVQQLRRLIMENEFVEGEGHLYKKELNKKYFDYLRKNVSLNEDRPIKVVVDCGSGTPSLFVNEVFSHFKSLEVVYEQCKSDSAHPNGVPDPANPKFKHELAVKVLKHEADIGVCFDNDADRVGFVDDAGQSWGLDKILMLVAAQHLETKPGGAIAFDVKSTSQLKKVVADLGGQPRMLRTGHPYFLDAMAKGVVLAGEFSGHMYFGDTYFGYDDGIYSSLRLIKLLSDTDLSFSTQMSRFPKMYHSDEIKIDCDDEQKMQIMNSISKIVAKLDKKYLEISLIDGVRIRVTDTGWFLIRMSNTTPHIKIRAEGIDYDEAKAMLAAAEELLDGYGLDLSKIRSSGIVVS